MTDREFAVPSQSPKGDGNTAPMQGASANGADPVCGNDRLLAELLKEAIKATAPPRHGWYLMNASFGFITEAIGRRKRLLGVPKMFPLDDRQRLELEVSMLNDETKAKLAAWARRVKGVQKK